MVVVSAVAIIVGIIAFGLGKLSVFAQQDYEQAQAHPEDPMLGWDSRQFELWSKAQENEMEAERESAKLIPSLSLASIAGVVALGQLKIISIWGVVVLSSGFFIPIMVCISNMHLRQAMCNERARRLREAFDLGQPMRRLPSDNQKHSLVSMLSKAGAVSYVCALLLTLVALPARNVICESWHGSDLVSLWTCSGLVQSFAR